MCCCEGQCVLKDKLCILHLSFSSRCITKQIFLPKVLLFIFLVTGISDLSFQSNMQKLYTVDPIVVDLNKISLETLLTHSRIQG